MDLMLAQRRAVVIGGSRGIGAAIVHELAAEGAEVAFCARDANGIALALEKLGTLASKVSGRALDLRDSEALKQWFDELQGFDILVLNASALSVDWDEAIALDLQANLAVAEAALPWLERSPVGALTYIGSKAGSLGAAKSAAYGIRHAWSALRTTNGPWPATLWAAWAALKKWHAWSPSSPARPLAL